MKKDKVADKRFNHVHTDPRFRRAKKKTRDFDVDKRFQGMFTDKSFKTDYIVDKYGRRINTGVSSSSDAIRKYYNMDKDSKSKKKKSKSKKKSKDEGEGEEEGEEENIVSSKAAVDPRFASMLTDKRFQEQQADSSDDGDDDDDDDDEDGDEDGGEESNDEDLGGERDGAGAALHEQTTEEKLAWMAAVADSSSDDSSSEEEEEAEEEVEDIPTGDATKRFAVLNLEWSRLRAVDLLVIFRSFVPSNTNMEVEEVTVYPSEYGLQKMEEEAKFGPVGLFTSGAAAHNASSRENAFTNTTSKAKAASAAKTKGAASKPDSDSDSDSDSEPESDNEGEEIDQAKLRQYEKDRLRYYYAVVTCDSAKTGRMLYDACDGTEFESSANEMDIRFIPDGVEFEHDPRDSADNVPSTYEPPAFFVTKALSQTNVELTWDKEDPNRREFFRKSFNKDDQVDDDMRDYLASDNDDGDGTDAVVSASDSEAEEEDGRVTLKRRARSKFAGLLAGLKPEMDEDNELEIVFDPGLKEAARNIANKALNRLNSEGEPEREKTVFEKFLDKRKEKRKQRKKERKEKKEKYEREKNGGGDAGGEREGGAGGQLFEDDIPAGFLDGDDYFSTANLFEDGEGEEGDAGAQQKQKTKKKKNNNNKEEGSMFLDGGLNGGEGFAGDSDDDGDSEESSAARKKREEREKAELELLTMDVDESKGYDLKQLIREHQSKGKKGKKQRRKNRNKDTSADAGADARSSGATDAFSVDVKDSRFQALFNNPTFAMDPTNPNYKPTEGTETLMKERRDRRRKRLDDDAKQLKKLKKQMKDKEKADKSGDGGNYSPAAAASSSSSSGLANLVASVKRKNKASASSSSSSSSSSTQFAKKRKMDSAPGSFSASAMLAKMEEKKKKKQKLSKKSKKSKKR